jgi:hypothetical protein
MSGDFHYKVLDVRHSSRYKAMRSAVYFPIFGDGWIRKWGVGGTAVRLTGLWRKRVLELRNAGWHPFESRIDRQYARNCPPFGVIATTTARACGRAMVCPLCYARRYVLKSFLHLEEVLFGGTHPLAKPREDLRLVEFVARQRVCLNERSAWEPGAIFRDWCPWVNGYIYLHRRREVDILKPQYGVVLHRIFVDENHGHGWLARSGLLLVHRQTPASWVEEVLAHAIPEFRISCTRHKGTPTKRLLREATGRAFAYPVSMLRADPAYTVAVLRGFHRTHMLATYGPQLKCAFEKEDQMGRRTRPFVPEEPEVPPDVREALGVVEDIKYTVEKVDEHVREEREDFFGSVVKKAKAIGATIEKTNRVTAGQREALDNMLEGVRKWVHDDEEDD